MWTRMAAIAMVGALSFGIALSAYAQLEPGAPVSGYGIDREASLALAGPG